MKKSLLLSLSILTILCSCKKKNDSNDDLMSAEPISSKYACVPAITDADWYKIENVAPLLEGYDAVDYPITTKDTLVQRYFNQGMTLAYGFNHAEAARSFL